MATLNENVAAVKCVFSDIKGCVNAKCEEYTGEADHIKSETKPEDYGGEIYEAFDDVHEAGKQSVISNSKYIPKTATGKVIALNDVSEVYHKVKVYADEPTEVEVYEKNLFNNDVSLIKEINYISSSGTYTAYGYEFELPVGTYTISATAKEEGFSNSYLYGYVLDKDNKIIKSGIHAVVNDVCQTTSFTIGENEKYVLVDGQRNGLSYATKEFAKFDLMLEAGIIATPYEPYNKQTITATANGTEVNSLCPNMTFLADSDITVDYYGSFGMQTEYDRFWDSFQSNGERAEYSYGFGSVGWNDNTFKPKYDIRPTVATGLFTGARITDLVSALEKAGVVLDLSKATNSASIFRSAYLTRVPYFVAPKTSNGTYMFNNDIKLHTIEGIECSETTVYTAWFNGCTSLTRCIFSGVIANDLNTQWCPFDDESLISLSVALAVLEELGLSGKTLTLHPDCVERLKELTYPQDDIYNPLGDLTCYTIVVLVKGWDIA